MRIVQVANFYGPRSGGLRTAVDQLGAGYVANGHDVVLIVPGRSAHDDILASGVRRVSVAAAQIPFTGGYRAADPRVVTRLAESLRPDVIEVSDRLTLRGLGSWAQARGVRSVMISHERLDRLLGQIMPVGAATHLADAANRRTASSYDAVVCTTAYAREEFDRIDAANVLEIPLGVDLDVFHPGHRRQETDVRRTSAKKISIVHCGRLSAEKHVDRSIDAIARLCAVGRDVQLSIIGDGPLRARLERRAAGLPIDFLGFIGDRRELAVMLASADLAFAPGPHETFGLAALESLASGTPVVVSRSSALASMVTPLCGAAAQDSADGFATAADVVLGLPEVRRRVESRLRAEQFGWPRSVNGMLGALSAVT